MKFKEYPYIQAKHYSSRKGYKPEIFVNHYTAGSGNSIALANFFARGNRKASAHFGIGRVPEKGYITRQMVDTEYNAWHPGKSRFKDGKGNIGRRSIGLEICNKGYNTKGLETDRIFHGKHRNPASKSLTWEGYTEAQYVAFEELLRKCKEVHPTLKYITGHEDIRNSSVVSGLKGSKLDPSPAFDWERFVDLFEELEIEEWHWSFKRKIWYRGTATD